MDGRFKFGDRKGRAGAGGLLVLTQLGWVAERFAFTSPGRVSGRQVITDIYPTVIRRSSWTILDYSIVHGDQASMFYEGNQVAYAYPVGILQASKNLVYNDGGAEIYR